MIHYTTCLFLQKLCLNTFIVLVFLCCVLSVNTNHTHTQIPLRLHKSRNDGGLGIDDDNIISIVIIVTNYVLFVTCVQPSFELVLTKMITLLAVIAK